MCPTYLKQTSDTFLDPTICLGIGSAINALSCIYIRTERLLFPMKFLIVSPRQTSGGAIVLHILCKLLMDHGHDAKIFYTAFDRKYPISYATFLFDHICFLRHDIPRRLKAQLFPKAKFTKKPRYNGYAYFPVKGCQQK